MAFDESISYSEDLVTQPTLLPYPPCHSYKERRLKVINASLIQDGSDL